MNKLPKNCLASKCPNQDSRARKSEATILCSNCTTTFSNATNLYRHLRQKHKNQTVLCQICGEQAENVESLIAHNKTHNPNGGVKKGPVRERQQCSECNKWFESLGNLNRHKKNVHEAIKFICHFCGKSLTRRDALIRHLKAHLTV